ncbi:MAG: hypothetical protein KGI50_03670 [Patescibacteria group bacterium]|nr:hypothetical protein [Patescibacteria group bacterium]MDE2438389.1 hypothetical protein [Patescibacteria group bacterium]
MTAIVGFLATLQTGTKEVPVVIVGSDGRINAGDKITTESYRKVFMLDPHLVLGISGNLSLLIEVVESCEEEMKQVREKNLSVAKKVRRVCEFLKKHSHKEIEFFLAGCDPRNHKCFLYQFSDKNLVFSRTKERYAGIGIGAESACVALMMHAGKIYTEGEAIALMHTIMQSISKVNITTGGQIRVHLVTPDGVKEKVFRR